MIRVEGEKYPEYFSIRNEGTVEKFVSNEGTVLIIDTDKNNGSDPGFGESLDATAFEAFFVCR